MPPKKKTDTASSPRPAGRVVTAARYRVIRGLTYAGTRAEPGEIRDDIPAASVGWLSEQGHIERVEDEGGED